MFWFLKVVFGMFLMGLSADAGFDERRAAFEQLDRAWPVSAPSVLVGLGSADAEVRYRCGLIADARLGRWWRSAALVAACPAAVADLTAPKFEERWDWPDGEREAFLSAAHLGGLIAPGELAAPDWCYAYRNGVRRLLWARGKAVAGGAQRADLFKMYPAELGRLVGDR